MDLAIVGLPEVVVAQETTTQEPAHEEEERNPVLPATDELIWGAISFAILFVLLARFAFPPLRRVFEERREKIQGDLEKAEATRQESEQILARYEDQLKDARSEAGRIIDEARKTADRMRQDLLEKAEAEARQVVARAQEEIRGERDRAFEELRSQVGELSVELATRVVGESLDRERQLRLVDSYIDELMGNGGS